MSLPPGFLDELRTRLSLSDVVGRKVMWDSRKSNQAKGDMWAPCPFHQEKTASFHVDDRKGYYYCFGCHAKGDAISFIRETENVGFMEAIEILAGEAGMQVPERDPRAQEKADHRTQLAEVMEQAVQFFRLQLKTAAASDARDYLTRRGLSAQAQDQWEIGIAPDAWQALWDHLRGKDVAEDLILGAGLAKPSTKGGKPYDTFRNRIIFPIRDARGRAIAFGGRAMDPTDNAKYLNSPETDLFDKGRSLYNHGPAREAAGKGQPLIVAEGYMDVIALSEAGFGATVAPLGTAITEDQLRLLWRIHPEPIIALDGDTAGLRAAMRVIDLALPMLEAGQSLRFALMPEGKDPDDVLKTEGREAMQTLIDAAQPMVRLLWQRETDGKVFDSPERKAALDKSLREAIGKIQDPSIRRHYGDDIKQMRWDLFRPQRPNRGQGGWQRWSRGPVVQPGTKKSALVASGSDFDEYLRESVILATILCHPLALAKFETQLERIEFHANDHLQLQSAILAHADLTDRDELRRAVEAITGPAPLEKLFSLRHVQICPAVMDKEDHEKAELCLSEELAKLTSMRGAAQELQDAMEEMSGLVDEGLTWRLGQAAEARNRAARGDTEDKGEYDVGDNGAKMNRDERERFQQILDGISFAKGRGRHP